MHPHGGSPLESSEIRCKVVMDMVYRPLTTELLSRAKRQGVDVISGVEMFLAQAYAQFEIWTGERAPEAAVRKVILAELDREEKSRERK